MANEITYTVGMSDGRLEEGDNVGSCDDGLNVGCAVGPSDGCAIGDADGLEVGDLEGDRVGDLYMRLILY